MPGVLDLRLLRLLRTRGHAPALERAVERFSRSGEHGALWLAGAAAGAALDRRRRPVYARAGTTIAAAYLTNIAFKYVVRRPRPMLSDLPPLSPTISGLTYPSAHAATSFAGAYALGRVLPPAPLYALAAAMAFSRPYLGVHYPSDSLAGAALGSAVAVLAAGPARR